MLGDVVQQTLVGAGQWFTSRRWFGDKSRSIGSIRPRVGRAMKIHGGWLWFVHVEFTFLDGDSATYFVPVLTSPSRQQGQPIGEANVDGDRWHISDALDSTVVREWFLGRAAASAVVEDLDGAWRWRTFGDGSVQLGEALKLPSRVLGGEQSNTSIRYGETIIAKVFRRLQPGISPDVEIGSFLRTRTDFMHSPEMYGTAEWHADDLWSIASFQSFQANTGDGWTWLLDELRAEGASIPESTLEALATLGQRTAELHLALASAVEDEAFRPEPYDHASLSSDIAQLHDEVALTLSMVAAHNVEVADILLAQSRLSSETDALLALADTSRIRIHGDYHLGQVLRTNDEDFSILDFEGEPARPIEQRRQKSSALRDVAGMLRSLDYALAFKDKQDPARVSQTGRAEWSRMLRSAFLSGYTRTVFATPQTIVPIHQAEFSAALRALEIQKALYEVRYELDNRPDWVSIPLAALGLNG